MFEDEKPICQSVNEFRTVCLLKHINQKYGEHPYSYHLDGVAEIVRPYGEMARMVAYGHDLLEDTDASEDWLDKEVGGNVRRAISICTDPPGVNRKERKRLANLKMSDVGDADTVGRIGLIVKAADRLFNMRESAKKEAGSKLDMYIREYPAFKEAAYREGLCDKLWAEMDQIFNDNGPSLASALAQSEQDLKDGKFKGYTKEQFQAKFAPHNIKKLEALNGLGEMLIHLTEKCKADWVQQGPHQFQTEVEGRTFILTLNGKPVDRDIYGMSLTGPNFHETMVWWNVQDVRWPLEKTFNRLYDVAFISAQANTKRMNELLEALR